MPDKVKDIPVLQEIGVVLDPMLIKIKTIKKKHLEQMRQVNYKFGMKEILGEAIGYAQYLDAVVFVHGDQVYRMAAVDIVQFKMNQYADAHAKGLEGEEYSKVRDMSRDSAWEWIYSLPQLFAD